MKDKAIVLVVCRHMELESSHGCPPDAKPVFQTRRLQQVAPILLASPKKAKVGVIG